MTSTERYRAARRDPELAVLEGLHALKHALRFGGDILDVRARDPDALARLAAELAPDVAHRIMELARPTHDDLFGTLSPAPHPTGVIALARRPATDPARILARAPTGTPTREPAGASAGPIVLLERPTHHGNIGAVVRVAAAAGAAAVLVTGAHDPWHPTSIRGGAGLQFALPVASLERSGGGDAPDPPDAPAWMEAVLGSGRALVVLDPEGTPMGVGAADGRAGGGPLPPGCVLVFGSERTGVSPALLERADQRIAIPMRPGVSSLNLATAVAIALYVAGPTDASSMRP